MRSVLTLATAGVGASASVIASHMLPRGGANDSFTLVAHGKASGIVRQLYDGQNRVGGDLPIGYYTIKSGGTIVDKYGRGCILTPPTTQWQCDEGVGGTRGFDISCDKQLLFNGSPEFWACPVNDYGVWNLYTKPNFGQEKCVTVTIKVVGEVYPTVPCKQPTPPPKQECPGPKDKCNPPPPKPECPGPKDKCNPLPPKPECPGPKDKCNPPPPPKEDCHGPKDKCNLKPSPDGTCGGTTGFHCKAFSKGSCCSSYGWCGSTPAHCGAGCQAGFGSCDTPEYPPLPPPAPVPSGKGCPKDPNECKPVPSPICPSKNVTCKPVPITPSPPPVPGRKLCPIDLKGLYEFPHLIVPVDKSFPDKMYGNQLNGTISPQVCTVYNFDIHPSLGGKTCSLVFLLPRKEDLETSSYTFKSWGADAGLDIYLLDTPTTWRTSWRKLGPRTLIGQGPLYPDVAVGAYAHECAAGQTKSVMLCGRGLYLEYFQDFNPSPIGLYVRAC